MNRFFLLRFSITSLKIILNKKFSVILNFAIFLTFFAITVTFISIYYEDKIEKLETNLIKDEIEHIVFTKWLNRTPKLINDINNVLNTRKSTTLFTPMIKFFPDDDAFFEDDSTTSVIYSPREEFYKYYMFIMQTVAIHFDSINLILFDSEFLATEEKDIQSVTKQEEFVNNLTKEFNSIIKEERIFKAQKKEIQKNLDGLKKNPQNYYLKYDEYVQKSLKLLNKQRNFYLNFSLNYFSNKRAQFNENNSTTHIEITNMAKLESRLILFAFVVQFFIFLVLQFFEITLERENQKKKKKTK